MRKFFGIVFLVMLVLITSGCTQREDSQKINSLEQECISACQDYLKSGKDLSNGPCLLDPMSDPHWVCDVAHSPRESVDNLRENQCSTYGRTANHFIEVNPKCEIIRVH